MLFLFQLALGEVDMAIGGDQGGSIRIPASFCGIVGLKPTHGLVPYSGAMAIEPSVDHLGPMARSVQDVAVLLNVRDFVVRYFDYSYISYPLIIENSPNLSF